jgi:hypothetical protein
MAWVPAGPRSLAPRYVLYRRLGAAALLLVAIAAIGGYGVMSVSAASQVLHEQQIWDGTKVTVPAEVDGDVTTRQLVLKSYDLVVKYSGCGGVCKGKLEFDTLGGGIGDGETLVRFDPKNHRDFALNVALETASQRWLAAGFFAVVGIGLIGFGSLFVAYLAVRQIGHARRAIEDGVEEACRIVSVTEQRTYGQSTGQYTYRFRLPDHYADRGKLEYEAVFNVKKSKPLLVDDGAALIALVPRTGKAVPLALREDLYPVVVGFVSS